MRRPNGLAELGRSTTSLPSSAPTQRAQSVNPKAPRARKNTRANLCDTTPLRGGSRMPYSVTPCPRLGTKMVLS